MASYVVDLYTTLSFGKYKGRTPYDIMATFGEKGFFYLAWCWKNDVICPKEGLTVILDRWRNNYQSVWNEIKVKNSRKEVMGKLVKSSSRKKPEINPFTKKDSNISEARLATWGSW